MRWSFVIAFLIFFAQSIFGADQAEEPFDIYYAELDLTGQSFAYKKFSRVSFVGVKNLKDFSFEGTEFDGVDFSGCDLTGVNFRGAKIRNGKFDGAFLITADFTLSVIEKTSFVKAKCSGIIFDKAKLFEVDFSKATCDNANFACALKFIKVKFDGTSALKVILSGIIAENCSFRGAQLHGAEFVSTEFSSAIICYDSLDAPIDESKEGSDFTGATGITLSELKKMVKKIKKASPQKRERSVSQSQGSESNDERSVEGSGYGSQGKKSSLSTKVAESFAQALRRSNGRSSQLESVLSGASSPDKSATGGSIRNGSMRKGSMKITDSPRAPKRAPINQNLFYSPDEQVEGLAEGPKSLVDSGSDKKKKRSTLTKQTNRKSASKHKAKDHSKNQKDTEQDVAKNPQPMETKNEETKVEARDKSHVRQGSHDKSGHIRQASNEKSGHVRKKSNEVSNFLKSSDDSDIKKREKKR